MGFAAWILLKVWTVWIFRAGGWVYSIGCSEVSLSGVFPLDASSRLPFPVMTSKNVSRHCQTSFRGKKIITVENPYPGSLDMTSYSWLTSPGLCTEKKKLIEVVNPSPEAFLPRVHHLEGGYARIFLTCLFQVYDILNLICGAETEKW